MTDKDIRQSSETPYFNKFLLLKTEKLSIAVHILTGHLPPAEPLRGELRRLSVKLAGESQALLNENSEILSDTQSLVDTIDSILSMVYVLKGARLVSPANAHILEREYIELKNHFSNREAPAESTMPAIEHNKGHVAGSKKPRADESKNRQGATTMHQGLSRRETILNIIEGKDSYSLGTIAEKVKGVSPKTIQRDLLALVDEGVLKKTGERRWSRYMRP